MSINGDGKQRLADEVEKSADEIDHEQDAEDFQNCEWLLVKVLQAEQTGPQ